MRSPRSKLVVALVVTGLVVAGCGRAEDDLVGDEGPAAPTPAPEARLALEVEFSEPLRAAEPVEWVLVLRNDTDAAVSVEMPSGQKGDIVLRRDGEEHYRWSEDRAFTMALVTLDMEAGGEERFVLDEESLDVEPGTYELEASSTADPGPSALTRTVRVEG